MSNFKLKGNNADERLNHAETLLKHMQKKLHKTVVGIIPPTLVTSFVQAPGEDGLVLTAALPGGKITKGLVVVKQMPKEGLIYNLVMTSPSGEVRSNSFKTKRKVEEIELGLVLEVGSVLEFFIEGETTAVWTSFLWEAEMTDKRVKQLAIAELEALEDEGV